MEINGEVIKRINSWNIDINEFVYLYDLLFNLDWFINLSPASINKLKRLQLIDEDKKITATGEELITTTIVAGDSIIGKTTISNKEDLFEELWLTFPKNDGFRHFPVTRTLRWNKAETKRLYNETLKKYSHEQLLEALKKECAYKASSSTKENLFKYMKSSVNWFKDERYLDYMEEEEQTAEESIHGKDLA